MTAYSWGSASGSGISISLTSTLSLYITPLPHEVGAPNEGIQALPDFVLHHDQLHLLLGVLIEELLHGLVLEPDFEEPHGLLLVGDNEAQDGRVPVEHRRVVLGVPGERHHVEVQRLDVGQGQDLLLGLVADSRRVHEVALGDAVGVVEVLGGGRADSCDLVDADLELVGLEGVVQALVDGAQVDALQNLQVGELRVVEARIDELPVVLLLHLAEQVGGVLGADDGFHTRIIIIDSRQLQRPRHVEDGEVVVAAEHIDQDGVLVELQLRLERVMPGQRQSLHHLPPITVPIKPVQDQ